MSTWSHTIVFIAPIEYQDIAKRISRSLDPDVGGYEAFATYASNDGLEPATHVLYSTPVRDTFLPVLSVLIADATALKSAVDADYAARWPGEIVPTLAECETLLSSLQTLIDTPWAEALTQSGLTIITVGL